MIEANENIDEVTMRRELEFVRAQESFQRALSEGRLAARQHQGAPTSGRAELVAADRDGAGGPVAASATLPEVATSATLPVEVQPADPEAAWRHTRLAIAAGLVVLLLVVWIWQKKAGR